MVLKEMWEKVMDFPSGSMPFHLIYEEQIKIIFSLSPRTHINTYTSETFFIYYVFNIINH
jgi:hypothetical protein